MPETSLFLVKAAGLQKTYFLEGVEVQALRDVDLTIAPGEMVSIMGPSGSGKSTLMHILGCLDTPSNGSYRLEENDVLGLSTDQLALIRNKRIGFVFQSFNLLARTSALENVEMPMVYAKIPAFERLKKAREALAMVGLQNRENHFVNQLSGGEQQRVAIARALVTNPAMILADEPTGNLDSKTGKEILGIFQDLNRRGITIVLITHDASVAAFARRQILIKDGNIVADRINEDFQAVSSESSSAIFISPSEPQKDGHQRILSRKPSGSWFTNWAQVFKLAFFSLSRNPFRSLLTTLGIIIGVASIITIFELGFCFYSVFQDKILKLSSNLIFVRPSYQYRRKTSHMSLSEEDGEAITLCCQSVQAVAPILKTGAICLNGKNESWAQIYGSTPDYLRVFPKTLESGHFITNWEVKSAAKVCVLGKFAADELFPLGDAVGKRIEINRVTFDVVGVFKSEAGAFGKVFSGIDRFAVLPISTFKRRLAKNFQKAQSVDELVCLAKSAESIKLGAQEVTRLLRWRHNLRGHKEADFYVRDSAEMALIVGMMMSSILLFIVGIAGISLLVGGIGIMNIMLVSVTERTREIGIRMAIGARQRDLLLQFLIEAVVLAGIGGLIGILIGLTMAILMQIFMEAMILGLCHFSPSALFGVLRRFIRFPLVSLLTVTFAFLFSAFTGIFFGLYPAWKASKLDPIVALRTE